MTDPAATRSLPREAPGSGRVLTLSTISFTVMFAVWLMFGILGKPIQQEFHLDAGQLSWITALAVLNGSMWRLPAGMLADRIGGKRVMVFLLASCAIPAYLVSLADSYLMLLILAFFVGFVGNSFSVGIAWNSAWFTDNRKGFALGLFGAGNVGASVTKFIGPPLIAATAGATYLFGISGGWRLIPVIYAVLLLLLAVLTWVICPTPDRMPGASRPIREQLEPLKDLQVWRFSLYYVVVFGAYVALSAYLPTYYIDNFGVDLTTAGLLTATFIFPASLLRPVGGVFCDKFGPRPSMYGMLIAIMVTSALLIIPAGILPLWGFVTLVFIMGCAMGIGKAAVYKHIPNYFPDNVGSVGGLVGMLGGLGGFFLPPVFAYTTMWTSFPSSTFIVMLILTTICMVWMHVSIDQLRRAGTLRG